MNNPAVNSLTQKLTNKSIKNRIKKQMRMDDAALAKKHIEILRHGLNVLGLNKLVKNPHAKDPEQKKQIKQYYDMGRQNVTLFQKLRKQRHDEIIQVMTKGGTLKPLESYLKSYDAQLQGFDRIVPKIQTPSTVPTKPSLVVQPTDVGLHNKTFFLNQFDQYIVATTEQNGTIVKTAIPAASLFDLQATSGIKMNLMDQPFRLVQAYTVPIGSPGVFNVQMPQHNTPVTIRHVKNTAPEMRPQTLGGQPGVMTAGDDDVDCFFKVSRPSLWGFGDDAFEVVFTPHNPDLLTATGQQNWKQTWHKDEQTGEYYTYVPSLAVQNANGTYTHNALFDIQHVVNRTPNLSYPNNPTMNIKIGVVDRHGIASALTQTYVVPMIPLMG